MIRCDISSQRVIDYEPLIRISHCVELHIDAIVVHREVNVANEGFQWNSLRKVACELYLTDVSLLSLTQNIAMSY